MLQILFMILKFLGTLLLVVLGIILVVLLVVLFVPLRYRADVSFDGKPRGGVMVSWLLRLVTVRVNYDECVTALVKMLWFRLFDKTVWPAEEAPAETEVADTMSVEPATGIEKSTSVEAPVHNGQSERIEQPPVNDATKSSDVTMAPNASVSADAEAKTAQAEPTPETENTPWAESMVEKIVTLAQSVVKKISYTYQQLCGKVNAGQEKINLVRAFLADTENQNTLRLLWKQIRKLIKHILPRKFSGRARFGFDDPATTGQILTYISPFYGLYAKTLELEPVFDEKVMEGELHVKGHIRVASLLWIVIRVFLNKNFRVLLKKLMAMGKM